MLDFAETQTFAGTRWGQLSGLYELEPQDRDRTYTHYHRDRLSEYGNTIDESLGSTVVPHRAHRALALPADHPTGMSSRKEIHPADTQVGGTEA